MNAKEKAVELIEIFRQTEISYYEAKQCAIIAVKEIIKSLPATVPGKGYGNAMFPNPDIKYYQEVKTELEKM